MVQEPLQKTKKNKKQTNNNNKKNKTKKTPTKKTNKKQNRQTSKQTKNQTKIHWPTLELLSGPVFWDCKINRLHLCRGVRHSPARNDYPRYNTKQSDDEAPVMLELWGIRSKVKLATVVEGDQKTLFSIATTPRCRGGRYSFPRIAPLNPWYVPYIAEC